MCQAEYVEFEGSESAPLPEKESDMTDMERGAFYDWWADFVRDSGGLLKALQEISIFKVYSKLVF